MALPGGDDVGADSGMEELESDGCILCGTEVAEPVELSPGRMPLPACASDVAVPGLSLVGREGGC